MVWNRLHEMSQAARHNSRKPRGSEVAEQQGNAPGNQPGTTQAPAMARDAVATSIVPFQGRAEDPIGAVLAARLKQFAQSSGPVPAPVPSQVPAPVPGPVPAPAPGGAVVLQPLPGKPGGPPLSPIHPGQPSLPGMPPTPPAQPGWGPPPVHPPSPVGGVPFPPAQAPGSSPIPGPEIWARLHYFANPGSSGGSMALADSKTDTFADGQVIRGQDGTVVAFGQAGMFHRSSAVASTWGEAHNEFASAQGMAYAKAELSAAAYARGAYVKTPRSVLVMGETLAEAVARAEAGAYGSAGVGSSLFNVDASFRTATEIGGRGQAAGIAYLGLDSLGLPAVEFGGQAGGMAGSRAEAMAGTVVSLHGLIKIRVGAVAQGMAGAAAGVLGHFKFKDGDFALRLGGSAAAGVGGNVQTEVGLELGKLPKGVLMTTVAPVVQAPILLINSIGKLLGHKDKPGEYTPDLSDFPKIAGQTIVAGANMVATGAVEIAKDIGNGIVATGEGLATGAKFIGKTVASLFSGW